MRHLIFAVLTCGILLNACIKPKMTNYPINAELKAAFIYQVGTYWIYRDSISGMVDSFYVTGNFHGDGTDPSKNLSIENMQVDISEKNISPNPILPLSYYWGYYCEANILNVDFSFDNNKYPSSYYPFINYPFEAVLSSVSYATSRGHSDKGVVYGINDIYHVGNHDFSNVAEVNHFGTLITNEVRYNDIFYICQEAGIIKMRLNHPLDSLYRVWELQRWKIVK